MNIRTLRVFFESDFVGDLADSNGVWSFSYSGSWLEKGFPLAPALPFQPESIVDGSTLRCVQTFFDNLLPEEAAKQLMAKDAGIAVSDHFSLLQYYGYESAGALTLLPPDETLPELQGEQALTYQQLSVRIQKLPQAALSQQAVKRMSLAGAQHKLPIILKDEKFFEPLGATLSEHILKPDHPQNDVWPHTAANEWFVMSLAKRVGLAVPSVHFFHVPESVYLVDRFDRDTYLDANGLVKHYRRHTIDGCQLLQLAAPAKYDQCTVANLKKLAQMCRRKLQTRQLLFEWLVFNYLTGNTDAHLKNLSVFCTPSGYELTPHYDLLCTSVSYGQGNWMKDEMVTPIGSARRFCDVTASDWQYLAVELGVTAAFARKTLTQLSEKIVTQSHRLFEESRTVVDAGEERQLSLIIFGPITEACQKISQTLVE